MRRILKLFVLFGIFNFITTSCTEQKHKETKQEKTENDLKIDSNESFVSFAFLNTDKDSLVSLEIEGEIINPKLTTHAIIDNKIIPITFLETKPESEASNGRQTSRNFSNSGGDFFTINAKVKVGDFALLVDQNFINHNKPLPFKTTEKESNEQTKTKLSQRYNRKITKSVTIAELENQANINLTLFEVKNDSALAVLSYFHQDQIITLDFPAKYDEMSTWRVDDGGVFDFENLQILSIFQADQSIKIATVFWGAEGYNLNFYESTNGVFKNSVEAYGYSAPL